MWLGGFSYRKGCLLGVVLAERSLWKDGYWEGWLGRGLV